MKIYGRKTDVVQNLKFRLKSSMQHFNFLFLQSHSGAVDSPSSDSSSKSSETTATASTSTSQGKNYRKQHFSNVIRQMEFKYVLFIFQHL